MSHTFIAPVKDPAASLRHSMSWVEWLDTNETITAQTVTAEAGLTVSNVVESAGVVSYSVSSGEAGRDYVITCRVTTSTGRIDERSVLYTVRNR